MPTQLTLDLGHRPASGREDFLVAPCNAAAVGWIDRWPDWPGNGLAIFGPAGCGKTHLAEVWRAASGALLVDAEALGRADVPALVAARALAVENIGVMTDEAERTLFHLMNLVKEEGAAMLLTSREAPARLAVRLPDLASRLRAVPHAGLGAPDDALLAGVLVKLFDDRQLRVPPALVSYLAQRVERSIAAAREIVAALDRASLSGKRPITVPLAAEVLERAGGE